MPSRPKLPVKPAKKAASKPAKQQFWGDRLKEAPEMANVAYCAGRDVAARPMADEILVPFDVWQNRAHTTMLAAQKVIAPRTAQRVLAALDEFEKRIGNGSLRLDPAREDVHTNIEHFVAELAGTEISGVMHTGRSRNDQTTTVVRLFVRDRLLKFGKAVAGLVEAILAQAERNLDVPVAGFTHYQPASVTTMGHWFASYGQALLRDLERILASYERVNRSPLGAAASFGTSWPLDRTLTARLLGFASVQANSLDCVTNRWEMEADAATAVEFALTHLSIISQDLILLSAPQFGIIEIADRYVTGSSIMPQKRNPDFAEVTRAKAALVQNLTTSLFGIARGALSGYNRDTQWTKYLILDIFDEAADAPTVFRGVFDTLSVNAGRAEKSAGENFVDAVDVADVLARESGLTFRDAYNVASKAVRESEALGRGSVDPEVVRRLAAEAGSRQAVELKVGSPREIAARKSHIGGPAPRAVQASIRDQRKQLSKMQTRMEEHERSITESRALASTYLNGVS